MDACHTSQRCPRRHHTEKAKRLGTTFVVVGAVSLTPPTSSPG
ncbi:hypothetical protein [Streptomyces sp. NBC_01446]|uniref:Uncharacterized protein n=1 Tax=Streptomyces sp. NBC_00119 TaxID=2975659 RepID=A0AAU1UMT9_9ACTN|nr:hypothetical protein [Streptomyces sp. NBC_01446]MCX4648574.1 hypothetical protein [Streptomyces sp. NBC_01446]MCX5323306.1 hypothetical protein [Streptomyces sp. NBC_00120]